MRKPATKPKPAPAWPCMPAWLPAMLLGLATLALYWPATRHEFVNYDDEEYVTLNPQVQAGLNWESIKWASTHRVSSNWHPLTLWSHMLDCQLYGLHPWGHHLTNILLHAVNTGLVFLLLRRLTGAVWRSVAVAALFGWLPVHVESVAWVAERKDVLSTFFGLLALMFYARYARKRPGVAAPFAMLDYTLAFFFLALGLMSKPMLVTWPVVMLLLDYWPLGRMSHAQAPVPNPNPRARGSASARSSDVRWRLLVGEKIPFFALAAGSCIVTFLAQKRGGAMGLVGKLSLDVRLGNALISYCRYLGKLFWPAKLAVFYPLPEHLAAGAVLLAGGLLAGLSVLFWGQRRRRPFLLMGWLWYLGTLVPVIGLVQVGAQAMADRYTYIPSIGVLILTVWGGYELTRPWRHQAVGLSVAGLAAMVCCGAVTWKQLGYWQNSETLFRHAITVTENNTLAYNNLGTALDKQGRVEEAIGEFREAIRLQPDYAEGHCNLGIALDEQGGTDEAIREYQAAIRLKPDYGAAHLNLGIALGKKGQFDEAINQYRTALRLNPDDTSAFNNLGIALNDNGQLDEAIGQYQEAIRLKPADAEARNNLGVVLVKQGRIDEAIAEYQEAIRLKPDYAGPHNNLGLTLAKQGRIDEAIAQYQEAIRLKPDDAETRNNLGLAFDQQGRIAEAIDQLQAAVRLKPDYAEAHNNLGIALDENGRGDEAIAQYQEAIRLKPDNADARNNLGVMLAKKGQIDGAIVQFQEAVRLIPDDAQARENLGTALLNKGRIDEAITEFQEAIRLKPDDAKAREYLSHALQIKNNPARH